MKRYKKERSWFLEGEQASEEARRARRRLEEGRGLIAGAGSSHYYPHGFLREFR